MFALWYVGMSLCRNVVICKNDRNETLKSVRCPLPTIEDNDDDELFPFEGQEEEVSDLIDDSDDDGDDADQQAFHIERMVAQ